MSKDFIALNLLIQLCEEKKVSFGMEGNSNTMFIYAGKHSYAYHGWLTEEELYRACIKLGALLENET